MRKAGSAIASIPMHHPSVPKMVPVTDAPIGAAHMSTAANVITNPLIISILLSAVGRYPLCICKEHELLLFHLMKHLQRGGGHIWFPHRQGNMLGRRSKYYLFSSYIGALVHHSEGASPGGISSEIRKGTMYI